MSDNRLWLGATITMPDGTSWTLVSVDRAREAKLLLQGTRDHFQVISLPFLLQLAGPAEPNTDADVRLPGDDWPQDVQQLGLHVREVFECIPMSQSGLPRDGYGPETTLTSRLEKKGAELKGTTLKGSKASLYRYWAEYKKGGLAALNARLHPRAAPQLASAGAAPELVAAIDEVLHERTSMPTVSRSQVIKLVRLRVAERFPEYRLELSDRTLRRYIDELDAGRYTFGKATTRRATANKPARSYGFGRSNRPGSRVEIDSTPLDLLVRDEDGRAYRPQLTVMLDVATAVPIAWALSPTAMTSFDQAVLLARSVTPLDERPGLELSRIAATASLPAQARALVEELMDPTLHVMPFIFPEEITIDGGADYRGSVFEAACRKYGVSLNLAAPRTPTTKPHVERLFRTINTGFTEYLAGAIGSSVVNRGSLDDPVWDLAGVEVFLEYWIRAVYLNTPTEALRDPFCPKVLWTPNQMYAALFELGAGLPLPFSQSDYISLMPVATRAIHTAGIKLNNRVYDSAALNSLRGRKSTGQHGLWEVRYDPYNPAAIWMRDPQTSEWLQIPDRTIDWRSAPGVAEASHWLTDGNAPAKPAQTSAFIDAVKAAEGWRRKEAVRHRSQGNLPQPAVEVPVRPVMHDEPQSSIDWDDEALDLLNPAEEL